MSPFTVQHFDNQSEETQPQTASDQKDSQSPEEFSPSTSVPNEDSLSSTSEDLPGTMNQYNRPDRHHAPPFLPPHEPFDRVLVYRIVSIHAIIAELIVSARNREALINCAYERPGRDGFHLDLRVTQNWIQEARSQNNRLDVLIREMVGACVYFGTRQMPLRELFADRIIAHLKEKRGALSRKQVMQWQDEAEHLRKKTLAQGERVHEHSWWDFWNEKPAGLKEGWNFKDAEEKYVELEEKQVAPDENNPNPDAEVSQTGRYGEMFAKLSEGF
ncbi:hypothetical protein N0V90_000978 [Kalmusia sp. IMI 367209]|nr:hypothetical protein N0V90_000978 [Kalmusia sp. IMI 367209]